MEWLDRPIVLGTRTVKNRIVLPPMADFGLTGPDGMVSQRHLEHYGAFARGGAGLIIIEACAVTRMREPRNTLGLFSDSCIPGMSRLARAARANGAVALVQLLNTGLSVMEERELALISRDRFLQYKEDFISAALRCKEAGFHGVELHAAHGYYLNQVLESSARKDEYGGSFENRARLLTELIREIKGACGQEFLVDVRFGNPKPEELTATALAIQAAGADLMHVSRGGAAYGPSPQGFAFDSKIYMASLVKRAVSIPVICVGGIATGAQAEEVLARGYADMVAVGRGQLCDPDWANKALTGRTPELCRRCSRCLWYVDGRRCPARCWKQA